MAQSCTYTFNGPDGKEVTIRGMAAMKAYLVDGGMEFFQTKGVRFEWLEKAEAKPAEQKAATVEPTEQNAIKIVTELAQSRPFDAFESVRDDALQQVREQTGKNFRDIVQDRGMFSDSLAQAVHDGQYRGIRSYAASMPVPVSESAIPREMANQAYSGTSFSPEKRGASRQREYVRAMVDLWREMEPRAKDDAARARLIETFQEVKEGYAMKIRAYLGAHSRVMSSMIAGPAKFPTRSNQKRSETADRRAQEADEYLSKARSRLIKALRGPVDDSPQSELQQAQAKLAEREAAQETMKKANALLRKNDDAGLRALGFSDEQIAELKKPDFAGRVGFPNYRLTNNNAEIRRLRGRVEELQSRVERVETEEAPKERTIGPGRIVENVAENRVQIFFDDKPSEEVRNALKSAAFRWAPSAGAWQRQLTPNAVYAAEQALNPFADDTPSVLRATDADPSNQRITRAQADGFISGFLAKYANAPQVTLVNTFDQLPATVQQEARNQGGNASDTKGVFHRGKVYLVAGNHSTVADFEATVFHEVIGHAGVRALFGDDFVKTANRLFMQLGGQAGLVKIMQKRGMRQQASDYIKGIAQAQRNELNQIRADMAAGKPGAQRRWNDAIARFVLTEEVFAHIAEQVKDRPSMMDKMKELIGKVRQWLRDKGFAELSSMGETDILFMLSKARQNMHGKDGGNITRNGVTVSGNDLMTSDGRRLNKDDPDYASAMRLADLLGLRQEPGVTTFRNEQGTIEVDGVQRPRTNSEGRPIHPTDDGIRNFWRFFKDSKAVDENGKPLVVYHGTPTGGFTQFDTAKQGSKGGHARGGFSFTTDREAARGYAEGFSGLSNDIDAMAESANAVLRTARPTDEMIDMGMADPDEGIYQIEPANIDTKREMVEAINYYAQQFAADGQKDAAKAIRAAKKVGASGGIQVYEVFLRVPQEAPEFNATPETLGQVVASLDVRNVPGRAAVVNLPDGNRIFYVADSSQIKSATGNTGAFDPNEAPITLRRAPSATQQQGKGRIGAAVDSFLNGRNDMPEWLAQMPAETQEAARKAGIWTQQKPLAERLKDIRQSALKRMQQGLLDQFAPLKELGEREYVLARLTKSADAPLESLLLYGRPFMNDAGAIDVNLEKGGLIGALQDLNGEHDRFFAWIAGNRAEQLKKEGRENLFSDTDISALKDMNDGTMADGRNRKAVYESMLLKFNIYSKSVLDIAEKAGIIAKEDRAIWEKDFYVPFYRAMEDGEYKGPKNASGLVNQYAFKKLQGGTDNLNDLMQNTLRNWSHLLSASLKNQAAAAALTSAEKAGVAVPVSQKQKGSVSYLGRVKRKIPKGQTYTENGVQKVSDGTAEIETVGEKHFMVEDPLILDAITSLEWAGWNNPAMKWMQRAKHYLTLGVTISPTFKIRNLIRDQIAAIGLNPMSYNMMQNLSQGWKGTDKDSAEYAKMLAGGGLMRFGTFLEDDRAQHMKRLIDAGVADDTILTNSEKVKAALGKAWDWWQEVGDRSENITRAAIYKQRYDQLVKEGKTQDEAHLLASFAARDSMDFSLQGQWGSIRFLTQLVPFLNARLQGLYKLGRDGVAPTVRLVTGNAEMGDKERAQRFGAVVGTVALASIALMLAYEDDEDWKNREEWDRDTYWWFKVGDTAYRIPKPFEIGAIGTLAERGLETAMNGFDKESRRIFVERLGAMLTGTFAMNPVPQLFKPLIDLYANTDSFTGRPIETMGMERLSKSERIGVGTSATAQLIGKATSLVGLSPAQVDHLIDGYFGWLGTHLAMTADFALRPMMGLPDQPARKWPDGYFVVGDFAKDLPANQSRYLTQFYEQSKKVQEAMADIRYYQSLGMTEKAMKLSQENKDEIRMYQAYSTAQRQIGEINKRIRMVQMSDKDAAVKRDEIDRLTQTRNNIAELTETRRAVLQ